jgi:hypothetical protein
MRKGMDGLAMLAQQVLNEDPFGGAFCGRRGGLVRPGSQAGAQSGPDCLPMRYARFALDSLNSNPFWDPAHVFVSNPVEVEPRAGPNRDSQRHP